MKTKQKLVLSLAALSAITLGVGATSTFAWFTTNRIASVSFVKTTVSAAEGNLLIKYVSDGTNGGATTSAAADTTYHTGAISVINNGTTATLNDISGNGLNFYRPVWNVNMAGTSANTINAANNTESKHYLVEFEISLQNVGPKSVDVYLTGDSTATSGTGIFAGGETTADIGAALASRCAVLTDNSGTLTVKSVFSGDSADEKKYLAAKSGTETVSAYGVVDYKEATLGDADMWHGNTSFTELLVKPTTDEVGTKVCTLATNGEQTIMIRTWIEGTSKYAVSEDNGSIKKIIGGSTKLNVKFAAFDSAA